MSRYIHWEEGEPEFLSSLSGWGEAMRWSERLPNRETDFPQLSFLMDEGYTQAPVIVLEELERAMAILPPDSDMEEALVTLKESITANPQLSNFEITQGFVTGLFVKWQGDEDEGELFASTNGWKGFIRWYNNLLNRDEFPQLGRLVEEHRSEEPALLEAEIKRAQELIDPEHYLYSLLDDLLFILEERGERTSFILTWDEDEEEEE